MLSRISPRVKLLAIVLIILSILGYIALAITSKTSFRLVNVSPKGTLPTSTTAITMEFNKELKPLDQQKPGFLNADPAINLEIAIRDKSLVITLNEPPKENSNFVLKFTDLESEGGDAYSESLTYKVKYVPYNKLSKEEKDRQAQNSVSPLARHPLLSMLPYDAIAYRMFYVLDQKKFGTAADWKAEKDNFKVYITTFALKDGTQEAYKQKHLNVRELAKQWIRDLGVDPDKDINIIYSPTDEELNGQAPPQTEDDFTGDGEAPAINEGNDTTTEPYLQSLPN